jgi:pimeloyl-ACP methyl ester carboxylesterase
LEKAAHRGERVGIGAGRTLRAVRAGPAASVQPLVVCEHGAFGCATDWVVVQEKLSAKGLRSLAYDRAGLGHSDPGPEPRDGRAINDDLEALLAALGEAGPILLVGHSMGGLIVRLFALERERPIAGLVLVDAVTPDVFGLPGGPVAIRGFGRLLQAVSHGAKFGLMVPVSYISGNLIGLPGEAAAEKRRIHASAPHAHGAAAEVVQWPETSRMAGAIELPPDVPVAVVTAGPHKGRAPLKRIQEAPAKRSRAGFIEHVAPSNHANLLGPRYADAILRAVEHVLQSGSR